MIEIAVARRAVARARIAHEAAPPGRYTLIRDAAMGEAELCLRSAEAARASDVHAADMFGRESSAYSSSVHAWIAASAEGPLRDGWDRSQPTAAERAAAEERTRRERDRAEFVAAISRVDARVSVIDDNGAVALGTVASVELSGLTVQWDDGQRSTCEVGLLEPAGQS